MLSSLVLFRINRTSLSCGRRISRRRWEEKLEKTVWKIVKILSKFVGQVGTKILTANTERITGDKRISVIHEEGGQVTLAALKANAFALPCSFPVYFDWTFQVYVLLIRNVTLKDAGVYICELNTPEVTRSFHELRIISDRLLAPVVASDHADDDDDDTSTRDSIDVWNYSTERPINHDYSDCCIHKNVSKKCLGFCNIKNILEGSTGRIW